MKSERGQAAVELGLVVLVLIPFILGIVDFGIYLYTSNTVNYLSQEAARAVSLESTDTLENDEVEDIIGNDSVSVLVTPETRGPGDYATITVTYSGMTYYVAKMLPSSIVSTSTIRVE